MGLIPKTPISLKPIPQVWLLSSLKTTYFMVEMENWYSVPWRGENLAAMMIGMIMKQYHHLSAAQFQMCFCFFGSHVISPRCALNPGRYEPSTKRINRVPKERVFGLIFLNFSLNSVLPKVKGTWRVSPFKCLSTFRGNSLLHSKWRVTVRFNRG